MIAGVDVRFIAPVTGTGPLGFQWQFNGSALSGETHSTLVLTNVSAANAGSYSVAVTSFGNSLSSSVTPLVVSSVVRQSWAARYGPSDYPDEANAIAADNAGNVYVTGHFGYSDIGTVKYDAAGNLLWIAHYYGVEGRAIAVDDLGNSYVTGITATNGDYGCATIKYNANGDQQWAAVFNGPANGQEGGLALALDAAGNVYVAGYSDSGANHYDFLTIKYDANGNQLWAARYDGPAHGDDFAYALVLDRATNVYVSGASTGAGTDFDFAVVKYDSNGNQRWAARYNGPGNGVDVGRHLAVDGAGFVYVTGWSDGGPAQTNDFATIKYDANGNRLWVARYNGPGSGEDNPHGLGVDAAGNVYVSGSSLGSSGNFDYALIKYDANGNQIWVARYDGLGNGDDYQRGLVLDQAGNVYISGYSSGGAGPAYGGTGSDFDFATLKYHGDGHVLWLARYDGPLHRAETVTALTLDKAGNVYVTGSTDNGVGNFLDQDYATVKYVQSAPAPFRLTASPTLPGGQFSFTLLGEPGRNYTIQASTDLVNWSAVTNFISATGTNEFTDAVAPSFSRRFYRAITQ